MEDKNMKVDENKSSAVMVGLLGANNLKYALPSNLSVVNSRTFQQNFADSQLYSSNSGTELTVRLQSSQGYVYGPNCYLRFDVLASGFAQPTAGDYGYAVGFLKQDAMSLFSRYLLESKSGDELERIENVNGYVRNCLPWKYPRNYSPVREMAGESNQTVSVAGVTVTNGGVGQTQAVGGYISGENTAFTKLRVTIPVHYFSGVFNCESLIPASLISGMLIRLTLASAKEALQIIATETGYVYDTAQDANAIFQISDAVCVLDIHNLSPVISKNLMEQSQKGLPFPYKTVYNQQASPDSASSFVLQINKAVSRAVRIWTYSQDSSVAPSIVKDNNGTALLSYRSIQTRVGSLYMPFQPINIPGASDSLIDAGKNSSELYINNLQAIEAISQKGFHQAAPSISKNEFSLQTANDNSNRATLIQTLEQSAPLAYSGISINNSRTAEQRIEYGAGKPANQNINSFLEYVKVANVYPVKTVIKE